MRMKINGDDYHNASSSSSAAAAAAAFLQSHHTIPYNTILEYNGIEFTNPTNKFLKK